jgi:hypothetical protein
MSRIEGNTLQGFYCPEFAYHQRAHESQNISIGKIYRQFWTFQTLLPICMRINLLVNGWGRVSQPFTLSDQPVQSGATAAYRWLKQWNRDPGQVCVEGSNMMKHSPNSFCIFPETETEYLVVRSMKDVNTTKDSHSGGMICDLKPGLP